MGGTNHSTDYNLHDLGGEVIPHGTEEKDLGVIITEDGKSSTQCAAAASKAVTKLRIIKCTFKHFDVKCFTMLYRTYIWNIQYKPGVHISRRILQFWRKFNEEPPNSYPASGI